MKLILLILILTLAACGAANESGDEWSDAAAGNAANKSGPASEIVTTSAGGGVWRFDWTFSMLVGAEVSIVERPRIPPATTDEQGRFSFDSLVVGDDLTLLAQHSDFYPTQTATVELAEETIEDFHIQIPPRPIVWALALVLFETLDPNMCQIASTVTEAGGNPFSTGIAGAKVAIDPPLPPTQGPCYFQIFELPNGIIIDIPVRTLEETTGDGGVVFINVPPGEYTISAQKEDMQFTEARIKCRSGVLVNAAPPYGLQVIE